MTISQPTNAPSFPPSIPPRSRHTWAWVLVAVVGLAAAVVWTGAGMGVYRRVMGIRTATTGPAGGPAARALPVLAATVRRGDLPIYLNGLGTVTALNTVTVRTRVDGQLMKVNFAEGQTVQEGEELALIDPRPFEVALEQSQAQKAKDEAQTARDEAQTAKDGAGLANARADWKRYQDAGDAATDQQRRTAEATVQQGEASVKQDEAAVVQDKAAVQVDQAQIDNAKLNLTYCHITAPGTGRIGFRMVDAGNMVHAADATGMAVITQEQPIAVLFSLSQDAAPQVVEGMAASRKMPMEVYDHFGKVRLATGELLAMNNQVDPTTAMVQFKGTYGNTDLKLFPSELVDVKLLVKTLKDAVLAPAAAIQHSPQTPNFVYRIKGDDTVELAPLTVGATEGDTTVVEEGLEAGDRVVTDGVDKLLPGMKVMARVPETRPAARSGAGTRGATRPAASGEAPGSTRGPR